MFGRKRKPHGGSFSNITREINLRRMQLEAFDLAVIGGGITGAGIARDAAMRGMTVALIEKGDFSSGTSSRSSKLIHGGLRYLKQLDIRLVKESLAERERLLRLAPHLVHPIPFLIPMYSGLMERFELRIGLLGYDFLTGDRSLGRHQNLSPAEVLRHVPLLRRENVSGGFIYHDCTVDDSRLTLASIKSAHEYGAAVANYTRAVNLGKRASPFHHVEFHDAMTGKEGELRARVVVAAVGPWLDEFLRLQNQSEPLLRPTKGVHVVFPKTRLDVSMVIVLPARDKRMIFVVPRGDFAYAGTTDTDYKASLDAVRVEAADVHYLLDALNHAFPSLNLGTDDIVSSWAGIRPLLRDEGLPSKLSRDYHISFFDDGLAVVAGGKLTTYRTMAKSVIDQVMDRFAFRFQKDFQPCQTAETALAGGEMGDFASYLRAQSMGLAHRWGLSTKTIEHLIKCYGRSHMDILALGFRDPKLLEPMRPDCPVLKAEVVYAVEDEMALTLEDFMCRRTGLMHFDTEHGLPVLEPVSKLMGRLLGWSGAHLRKEILKYDVAVKDMLHFP